MEDLKKIIRIITLFGEKSFPIIEFNKIKGRDKEERLLQNLINNVYDNDNEAIADLYGDNQNSYRYRMLKSRLRQKLQNNLFFVKNNSVPARKEEKECLDRVFQGKILMQTADYNLAEGLFKKALRIAKDYEFTDLAIESIKNLNFIYTHQPDYNLFYSSLSELKKYRGIQKIENEAYEIYYIAKVELKRSVASKKSYIHKVPLVIKELWMMWEATNSSNIFNYYYFLNNWHLELIGNFEQIIKDIENCEKLLNSGKINNRLFDQRLNNYNHIYALLRAKQYNSGLQLAPRYLSNFNTYSRNWFAFMQYYFLLAMHSDRYQLATDLMFQVDNNPYFKRLKQRAKEKWMLYKAYLHFIYRRAKFLKKFNYQEFIIQVPEYGKDKLGYNVGILILQFLQHLKNRDFDQLYYKEDSLRKYLNTYLKDPNSERSRLFFRLLIVTIRVDFNRVLCVKKAAKWEMKLKATPVPGDAYAGIEIIPYEKLWNLILGLLKE